MVLEVLNLTLMLFRSLATIERAEVASFAGLWIDLS
jgi:hypothetical protein